jgi:hypothetical protein
MSSRGYFFLLFGFFFFACETSEPATDFSPGVLFLLLSCSLANFAGFLPVAMLISLPGEHVLDDGRSIPVIHRLIYYLYFP